MPSLRLCTALHSALVTNRKASCYKALNARVNANKVPNPVKFITSLDSSTISFKLTPSRSQGRPETVNHRTSKMWDHLFEKQVCNQIGVNIRNSLTPAKSVVANYESAKGCNSNPLLLAGGRKFLTYGNAEGFVLFRCRLVSKQLCICRTICP